MSFAAESWAWNQQCPSSSAKAVLTCLGWFADHQGANSYPSLPTICRLTQHAERTVRKALRELEVSDLIERIRREAESGACLSTVYRLKIRETATANSEEGGKSTHSKSALPCKTAPLLNLGENLLVSKKESKNPPYSPPTPVGDGGAVTSPPIRKKPMQDQKVALPVDWEPPEELASEVTEMGVDPVKVTADIKRYWRLGLGQGTKRTLRGWNQTYLNRAQQLLQRGECLISRNAGGLEPWARRDADGNTWMVDRREGW